MRIMWVLGFFAPLMEDQKMGDMEFIRVMTS